VATPRGKISRATPGTAFGYPLGAFGNNSIPDGLGAAAACLAAYDVGGDASCVQVARDTVHWLFGQNPFGASFVVGLGTHYPKHPQHAFAQAAHKQLNGMIVGGPTAMSVLVQSKKDDGPDLHLPVATDPYAPYSTSSLVYDDNATDFVTSEAGIDYTAALVYILADLSDM
jgi:endoglucanase